MKKMDRCSYVNSIQNGDATVMLLTNENLIFKENYETSKKAEKITIL
jgi:hypothetical protein